MMINQIILTEPIENNKRYIVSSKENNIIPSCSRIASRHTDYRWKYMTYSHLVKKFNDEKMSGDLYRFQIASIFFGSFFKTWYS